MHERHDACRSLPFANHILVLVICLLGSGCELPAGLQELGALQEAVAGAFDIETDQVNVSTMSGAGGTELRVVFQNAEIDVQDAQLCERATQVVRSTYPSLASIDRIAIGASSRVGIGPLNATSQRNVCVVDAATQEASPAPVDSSATEIDSTTV